MADVFKHGYALLIGVGQTEYPKWSLPVTVNDTTALKSILTDPNLCAYPDDDTHIRLLTNSAATRRAILDGLSWLQERAGQDADATAIIFYAGHGWLDRLTGDYYLIQHDTDPTDVQGTALSAKDFTDALRQIQAERVLVIFDCCHAEGMATSREVPAFRLPRDIEIEAVPRGIVDTLKQGAGRAVFTSCLGKQLSYERPDGKNGVYTYHLLEALQGAGNQPGDTTVRLSNLMNYVGQKVPETVRRIANTEQTPFFDTTSEDFPVALLHGGRGLPIGGWEQVQAETSASKPGVAVGGNMTGGTINTGDHKVEQRGKYNINAEQMSGTAIGDGATIHNYSKDDE